MENLKNVKIFEKIKAIRQLIYPEGTIIKDSRLKRSKSTYVKVDHDNFPIPIELNISEKNNKENNEITLNNLDMNKNISQVNEEKTIKDNINEANEGFENKEIKVSEEQIIDNNKKENTDINDIKDINNNEIQNILQNENIEENKKGEKEDTNDLDNKTEEKREEEKKEEGVKVDEKKGR